MKTGASSSELQKIFQKLAGWTLQKQWEIKLCQKWVSSFYLKTEEISSTHFSLKKNAPPEKYFSNYDFLEIKYEINTVNQTFMRNPNKSVLGISNAIICH